ncbi:MAG TPA: DUF1656 domain-containing protein [Beijerinckia sp.]|nr:DUF1656 domain-containing protein [Beijerinckia sp.]
MTEEIDLYGIFVPGLLVWMACAFVLSVVLRRALAWCGFYEFVWHPALFDLALFVLLLGCVVFLSTHLVS